MPYGQSILLEIFKHDPRSSTIKILELSFSTVLLLFFPIVPYVLSPLFTQKYNDDAFQIIGLSQEQATRIMFGVLSFFLFLFITDVCGSGMIKWPNWMNTKNGRCYLEMFSEPKRCGQWIGHLGNTMSNFIYLFDAICVLSACINGGNHPFLLSDSIFGLQLLSLSFWSFIWHSSNAPQSHYFDLWVMENCIVYLQIRYICLVLPFGGWINVILYLLFIIRNGYRQWDSLKKGNLDNGCPFSGRHRMYVKEELTVRGVCAFMLLPIGYCVAPMIVLLYLGSFGHFSASMVTFSSLCIGWGLRMFERFCLDGWIPINYCGHNVLMAAVLSPTAIFHVLTGITLIAGYIHVRSLDN